MDFDLFRCEGDCKRLIRPHGSDPKLYPKGIVQAAKPGWRKCTACYKHERGYCQPRKALGLTKCAGEGCDHMLRPHGTTEADYPGTYQHRGRGLCWACWVDQDPVSPPRHQHRQPMPATCRECGRKLRPKRSKPKRGYVTFGARGLCTTCYAHDLDEERPLRPVVEQRVVELDPEAAAAARALARYLASRPARQRAS